MYPAVYRVAIFFAVNLALSALASDSFLSTNPSPLHSEHMPEPPQSSQIFKGICFLRKCAIRKISWKYKKELQVIMHNGYERRSLDAAYDECWLSSLCQNRELHACIVR